MVIGGEMGHEDLARQYSRRCAELRALLVKGGIIDSLGEGMLDRANAALAAERRKLTDLWPPGTCF